MSLSPASVDLAQRLVAAEALARAPIEPGSRGRARRDPGARPSLQVLAKLQVIVTNLAGATGYRSLLARAATLAKAQDPSLAAVRVLDDGSLSELPELDRPSSAEDTAGQLIVTHVLDLLITFIGEPLTRQLVRSVWPGLPAHAPRRRSKDTP